MENQAIIESFSEFKEEKNIDRVTLMAILEDALRNQLKKKYGDDENFDIIVNPDKGDLEIWRNRIIVADDEVEDDNTEIALTEALKIEPDFEVGEEVSEEAFEINRWGPWVAPTRLAPKFGSRKVRDTDNAIPCERQ
ncbi:MAG: NusA N-terminal domain-containing protein [Owenweeksia sp.]|nr:NusA N-terminal domain-containing protein [Owenweeksia sp.]